MKQLLLSLSLSLLILFAACRKTTTPPNPNEEELITTFRIDFTDSAGVQPNVTAIYCDTDGDGGNNPTRWDSIRLKANTTYLASILLLDESKSPADTISKEVLEEAAEHLFCFTPTTPGVSVQRTDSDGTYEVGLQSKWRSGPAGNGAARIVLKHQPGVKNGSCDPGDTDIDLSFALFVD